jgi:hypothetical protein
MLTEGLNSLDANKYLATLVYKKSLESLALQPSQADSASTAANHEWTLSIGLDKFATVGSGPDTPYSLQLSARIEAIRLGDKEPAFIKEYQATSPIKKTTAEWRANADEPVRSALDGMLAALATDISNDLRPIQLSLDQPLEDYRVSVEPMATEMKTLPGAVLKSEVNQSPSLAQEETSNPEQNNLFDPISSLKWVVVDSSPVDLRTANNICKTLDVGDKRIYRVPSLKEFEDLWKRYKNDERIHIFKKREFSTDGREFLSKSAYTRTFSFMNGNSGQLYAAYLTCVGK